MASRKPLTKQKKRRILIALILLTIVALVNRYYLQKNDNLNIGTDKEAGIQLEGQMEADQIEKELTKLSWGPVKPDQASQATDQAAKEDQVLQALKANFEGQATVEFSKEGQAFFILPVSESMKSALVQAYNQPALVKEAWADMVENFRLASEEYGQILGTGYRLHLLNPENPENSLVSVSDGQVTYDGLEP